MASVQFTDMPARPAAFLDFMSVTLDEFRQLVPPSRRHSMPLWPQRVSTGSPGPPASLAYRSTVPCLRTLGDAPARSLTALAQRLGRCHARGGHWPQAGADAWLPQGLQCRGGFAPGAQHGRTTRVGHRATIEGGSCT